MGEEVKEKKPNSFVEGCKGFCTFLYNPDDGTVLGRGGESWAKIILFYFVFYAALAGFFAVCLTVMLQTLDPNKPTVIGRTNKPKVAIAETKLYKIDFTNKDRWTEYEEDFGKLKKKYENVVAEKGENITKAWFSWSDKTLDKCSDKANFVGPGDAETKTACFFMGLNRIYNYDPLEDLTEEERKTSHLSFKCAWDKGKAGNGNEDPKAVEKEIFPAYDDQKLEAFYPWTSNAADGLQPIVALKVTVTKSKAEDTEDGDLATYLKCNAYIRNEDKTEYELPNSSPADFEIKYSNKADNS